MYYSYSTKKGRKNMWDTKKNTWVESDQIIKNCQMNEVSGTWPLLRPSNAYLQNEFEVPVRMRALLLLECAIWALTVIYI
jgi:hypothetical protein